MVNAWKSNVNPVLIAGGNPLILDVGVHLILNNNHFMLNFMGLLSTVRKIKNNKSVNTRKSLSSLRRAPIRSSEKD